MSTHTLLGRYHTIPFEIFKEEATVALKFPETMVQFCVVWFAKLEQRHLFLPFALQLPPTVRKSIFHKIGIQNVFNDFCCVGNYSLSLDNPEHNFVAQQLIWLAVEEP